MGWPHYWLLLATVSGTASVLAKEAGAVGLPILVLIPLLGRRYLPRSRRHRWQLGLLVAALVCLAFGGMYAYTRVLGAGVFRFHPVERVLVAYSNFRLAGEGVLGFLVSPGKGVFWHSPILLLALAAPWLARPERRLDTSWPLLMLSAFVAVYALVRGVVWFGGTNWGPL